MEREEFIKKVPYIYHLTDSRNLDYILSERRLSSAVNIINSSTLVEKEVLATTRREGHVNLNVNGTEIWIRDQRPLNRALDKCLTPGWTREQYIYLLNSRVFLWPNLKRLQTHYSRYQNENPVILKFEINLALETNPSPELCHLNSGATRPLGILGGVAPIRGENTFVSIEEYDKGFQKLAEVTFPNSFILPNQFWIGNSPNGNWNLQNI